MLYKYPERPSFALLRRILREPQFAQFTARMINGEIRLRLSGAPRADYFTDDVLDAIHTLYAWQADRQARAQAAVTGGYETWLLSA